MKIEIIIIIVGISLLVVFSIQNVYSQSENNNCRTSISAIFQLDYVIDCMERRLHNLENHTAIPISIIPLPRDITECRSLGYDVVYEIDAERNIEIAYCVLPSSEITQVVNNISPEPISNQTEIVR